MLNDDLLMGMFTKYVAWQNYAAVEFARAEVEEEKAEAHVKFLEAQHMVMNWKGPNDKVTVSRAEMAIDPAVDTARREHLQAYANRKLAQVMYGNCERCGNLISREITRRVGREPQERRNNRWTP